MGKKPRAKKRIKNHRWISFLAIGILTIACVGTSLTSEGKTASKNKEIWHEGSEKKAAVLPKNFNPLPSLSGLVKKLRPSVVNVFTTQVIKPMTRKRNTPQFRSPFDEFLGPQDPFGMFERFFGVPQREFKRNSLGSGFIVSSDGYLLTNHHVVANATEIKVKLADEQSFNAKVIGSDEKTDIALLKVEAKQDLPYVFLGHSEQLEVGDWVVAIGNPFGLGHTVTTGIISGKDRNIGQGPYDDFLQTDASINPGNSGGPLFDTAGNVIGINTAIIPQGSGIGFAVPINLAKDLLPQLQKKGKVTRGWLGIGIQDLTDELAENFDVEQKSGVLVAQVYQGSPAGKAGLEAGDIILSIDGKKVSESREVTTKIALLAPGTKTTIEVLRNKKKKTYKVVLGEREAGEAQALGQIVDSDETSIGLTVVPLTPNLAERMGIDKKIRGLVVKDVDPQSPAEGVVQPRDVILEVNRQPVTNVSEFQKALSRRSKEKSILLRIQRGNTQIFVAVTK